MRNNTTCISFQNHGVYNKKMSKKKSDFLKEENVRIHKETIEFQKKSKLKKEKFKESKRRIENNE